MGRNRRSGSKRLGAHRVPYRTTVQSKIPPQNPYAVLEASFDVPRAELVVLSTAALARGVDARSIQEARRLLSIPRTRIVLDLFLCPATSPPDSPPVNGSPDPGQIRERAQESYRRLASCDGIPPIELVREWIAYGVALAHAEGQIRKYAESRCIVYGENEVPPVTEVSASIVAFMRSEIERMETSGLVPGASPDTESASAWLDLELESAACAASTCPDGPTVGTWLAARLGLAAQIRASLSRATSGTASDWKAALIPELFGEHRLLAYYLRAGRLAEAFSYIKATRAMADRSVPPLMEGVASLEEAMRLAGTGDLDDSLRFWARGFELLPGTNLDSHRVKLRALVLRRIEAHQIGESETTRLRRGVELLETVLSTTGPDPELSQKYHDWGTRLAIALSYESPSYAASWACFERVVACVPLAPWALANCLVACRGRALELYRQGDVVEADRVVASGIRLAPDSIELRRIAGCKGQPTVAQMAADHILQGASVAAELGWRAVEQVAVLRRKGMRDVQLVNATLLAQAGYGALAVQALERLGPAEDRNSLEEDQLERVLRLLSSNRETLEDDEQSMALASALRLHEQMARESKERNPSP